MSLSPRNVPLGRRPSRACPQVIAALLLVAGGCDQKPQAPSQSPARIQGTVISWMECNDCRAGELDSVVALGGAAVPLLAAYLRGGPPDDRRMAFEQRLDSTYQRRSARRDSLAMTRAQFRTVYVRGLVVGYQERSARALGIIDGPAALDSLQAIPIDSVAPSVAEAIRCALDSLCRR